MTTRAEHFGAQFEAVNDEVLALVLRCTDDQWRRPCPSEAWPAGVVAHHIAVVHGDFTELLNAFAAGVTRSPGSSMEVVDRTNAEHAREYAAVGKPETLYALRTNGAAIVRLLGALSDEQFDRTAGVFGGRELSVA